jgi:two-component system, sensor histidine kinase and response regulator
MKGIVTLWNSASSNPTPPETPRTMQTLIADFPIKNERDAKTAGQRARLLGTLVDLPVNRKNAFGRAVQEITQNTIQHCGSGHISYRSFGASTPPVVEVVVVDNVKGAQEIQSILAQLAGPACGILRASSAVDQMVVETLDDVSKQVRIGMVISEQSADVDESDLADWAGILRTRRVQSALGSTQRRSQELAKQLAGIQRQRQELASELEQSRSMNEALTLLSLVASKTDNAVVIMNAEGLMTWVNDAFIRITGYGIQDASGARPDKLLGGPNTARESLREFEDAFQLGHGVSEEFQQYHREGKTSWIALSLTPIYDDDGNVTRWIGIGADITKRKEAERALENGRTAAENASQLKGEFLANISHEIRTPMSAIIGMTDLTLCTELDADQQEYLTTVKQSAESLLELLNDVLDLSKIEAGRLDIDNSAFDLRISVTNTLKPMAFVAEQQGLKLNVSIGQDVPATVVSDASRLRQILVNLVGNAIKFTPEGYVEVTVQKQWEADDEVGLEFIVADTGIGIPASKLDRIFEASSQADSSITRDFGGTGLGLTITSQLLQLMNGRVWVQSEVGKGSRFHFTLRCRLPTPEEAQQLDRQLESSATTTVTNRFGVPSSPLMILVADDHPANRKLIGKILQKQGHSIHFAKNGTEVLEQVANQEYDIILMDVQMPEMDGYQATAAIRERERETQTHVPIIAVTAHAMQGQREQCLAAGMDAYLSKPVKTLELVTLIDSLRDNEVNVSVTSATSTGYVALQEPTEDGELLQQAVAAELSTPADTSAALLSSRFADALERLDNDEELLREQMQFFLKDGPKLITKVTTAVASNSGPDLQLAAHRLKNLCATFDDNETAGQWGAVEAASVAESAIPGAAASEPAIVGTLALVAKIRNYLS